MKGVLAALAIFQAVGCGEDGGETICRVESAIVGGDDALAARILPRLDRAVGAFVGRDGTEICTGTIIAQRWVLTARHCSQTEELLAMFEIEGATLPVVREFPHAERDLMLVELAPYSEPARPSTLRTLDQRVETNWIGRTVTLAGFGDDEARERGSLRVVSEPITALDDAFITVDGMGVTGACSGDSGGPLLYEDDAGELSVVGVLSRGSADCRGLDRYTRVDGVDAWLSDVALQAAADPCGQVPRIGQCTKGGAEYCSAQGVVRMPCSNHSVCGWSSEASGYRCIPAEQDTCYGAAAGPYCAGSLLLRCDRGELETTDCGKCGGDCIGGIEVEEAHCE